MEIQYTKAAIKTINSMDKPTKQRIKAGIEGLTKTPPEGDIKHMQGFPDDRFRLRVGKYRIIYKYESNRSVQVLLILDIGSRGDIYK